MAFNKMFVMIPLMLAVRQLDGEDPTVLYYLRIAYGVAQAITFSLIGYAYIKATAAATGYNTVIYVPPAPQPFADPNTKKKYTEAVFEAHVKSQARSLVFSTLFGVCVTVGLHLWRGMVVGLAIQSIMGPLNLVDNPIIKALLFGSGISPEARIFDEKQESELTDEDEIVDAQGNPVVKTLTSNGHAPESTAKRSFEDILLDTWDEGAKADLGPLMETINKTTANFATKENEWTPVMILSGLGVKGSGSAVKQTIALGGNPEAVDGEGWTCLHWAAFHGSVEGAQALKDQTKLTAVKDKEGKTPLMHATAEGNSSVAEIIAQMEAAEEGRKKNE